jgi:hypothetical protein
MIGQAGTLDDVSRHARAYRRECACGQDSKRVSKAMGGFVKQG